MAFVIEGLECFERQWRKFSRGDESEVAESRKISVERTNHNGLIVLIFVDRFSVCALQYIQEATVDYIKAEIDKNQTMLLYTVLP